jgi:flagellar hook protein FlgE
MALVRSLNSGVSGMQQLQQAMDVIGNNIANANTTGYKVARVSFEDSFSQTLRAASPGTATSSNSAPVQVGTGVNTSAIQTIFSQGASAVTGNTGNGDAEDLFISGNGYFVVRDPLNGNQYVSRAGDFHFDEKGYLVTHNNFHVQGYSETAATATPDTPNTSIIGDLRLTDPSRTSPISSYNIDEQGLINVTLADGSHFVRGQILLQRFQSPQALVKEGNNLFSGLIAAGPLGGATPIPAAPGAANGLGTIQAGALELSNIDLANEFANLITTQRSFQANAKIITTSDEMLQDVINLKR